MAPKSMTIVGGFLLLIGSSGAAMAQTATSNPTAIYRGASTAVQFDISPPLREIAPPPPIPVPPDWNANRDRPTGLQGPPGPQSVDPVVQRDPGAGEIPTPTAGFDGPNNNCGCTPPDPNHAVGPNHVVVVDNLQYQVFDKTGNSLFGPAANNTLWAGFGGACQTRNDGDPVVLYDRQADRWLLTQFTSSAPYLNCVALSQTNDPTGAYYRWAFPAGNGNNFPDYPKYGVWPDAYYISTREFASGTTFVGVGAYAANRAQMLAGNPNPTVISFLVPPSPIYVIGDGLLPSNLDGSSPPPAGSPNYYIGSQDDGGGYGAPSDALNVFKFHADFANPANSTFILGGVAASAPFDSILDACGGGRACIPQPGTTNKLDHLGYRQRVLHRAAYRNFGGYESIVTNQSVEVATGTSGARSGIRWWEIRNLNTNTPTIFQQGTYAPDDGLHRWMGSIAQDKQGNMALGFSVSSGTVFPGIRYTGRLLNDPLGTFGQAEGTFLAGTGSQTGGGNRWGDYTAMVMDPVDDCTFWYVNQYIPTTSANGWRLHIGAFAYHSCAASHDFNGDGRSDIAWRHSSGDTAVWLINGSQIKQAGGYGNVDTAWSLVGQRDFDGDGKHDWLWRNSNGDTAIWLLNGLQVKVVGSLGNVATSWTVAGTCDFDNDGKGDILWRDNAGNVAIWRMNAFQVAQVVGLGNVPTSWAVAGTADFNGDGNCDVLWRNSNGDVAIWFMNNGLQIQQVAALGNVATNWTIAGTGDFNADTRGDILWRDNAGNVAVWLMTGAQVLQVGSLGNVPTTWTITVTGDFDGNAKSDILWRNSNGDVLIWFMNGVQIAQAAGFGNVDIAWVIQSMNAD